ncbi:MBL fold metallo-hydrolase [Fundicoccus sp. Sow4_D5]|uniref:MBL fold metallo-hydrolase n=1 Tax=unclassified Fundicoccus TaxID=2761543 RepID=UPI003F92D453
MQVKTIDNIQLNTPELIRTDQLSFSILASGSSGNCTYIETSGQKIIVDAGLSGKKVQGLLAQIDRKMDDIDAIFVTHEHSDHVQGVGILSRKFNLPVYANKETWLAMDKNIGIVKEENRRYVQPDEMLSLGDLDIMTYSVSHDAISPQFYAFQKGKKQFVMLTDTGYVSQKLRSLLVNANAYLIESNHEIEMLRYGKYPWSLKQRILSDKGHLSNEDGALAMIDLIGENTSDVYLGHLSRDNNTKQLAMHAMEDILNQHDIDIQKQIKLHMTDPEIASPLKHL